MRTDRGRLLGPAVLGVALLLLLVASGTAQRLSALDSRLQLEEGRVEAALSRLSQNSESLTRLEATGADRAKVSALRTELDAVGAALRSETKRSEPGTRADDLLIGGVFVFGVLLIGLIAGQTRAHIGTEAALRDGEARYRLLVEYASDVIFQTDLELLPEYISPSVTAMFGYLPDELIGKPAMNLFHPDDVALIDNAYHTLLDDGGIVSLIARVRHRDGHWVWVEGRNRLVPDRTGAPTKIVGIITDISARRAAETALQESEENYRTLYANAPAIIYTVDAAYRVLTVTEQALALFGYRRDEVIGRKSFEFMTPESRAAIPLNARPEFIATGGVVDVPAQFLTKSGDVRDVLLSAIGQRSATGALDRTIVLVTDVTERKRLEAALRASEARAREIAENAGDVIGRFDASGRCTFASPSYTRVFGFEPEEILGRDVTTAVIPEDHPLVIETFAEMIAHKRQSLITFRGRHRDGRPLWLEANSSVICDPATGAVSEVVSIVRDVTERHLANLRIEEARREAEIANRAKSDFLATVSHELRTPMNGVLGFTSVLLDTDLTPEQHRLAARVRSSGEALLLIIDDILDLSKLEAGALSLERIPLSLQETAENAIASVKAGARTKHLTLATTIDDALPDAVLGDPARLTQVLTNLLSNAVKFTETGNVDLRIRRAAGADPDRVLFEVCDTGIGIAPDHQKLLFEPFSQIDGSMTRRFGGTGLGLAICRRLVEAMPGGAIGVDSTPGHGSRFWFTISLPERGIDAATVGSDDDEYQPLSFCRAGRVTGIAGRVTGA